MEDVWSFLMENFSIRPDRESHALIGVSMGGAGAYNMAIKHKDRIKIAMGFLPALNLRWVDCHGNYESSFDPECWGWRERKRPFEVIGRPKGPFVIRARDLYGHLIGHGPDAMLKLARINPIEVMDQYDLQPGDLHLYIGYGGKDEFNIMAQVESFLFRARERKIDIHVDFDPDGRHDAASARRLMPGAMDWFAALIPK
jgi:S-formylglutathione hydrolase FrmB